MGFIGNYKDGNQLFTKKIAKENFDSCQDD